MRHVPAIVAASALFAAPPLAFAQEGAIGQVTGTIEANRPSQAIAAVGPVTQSAPAPPAIVAAPLTMGIFTLTPGVTAGSFFDDNVYATAVGRKSDVAFFLRPEIAASAKGEDYGLLASAYVEGRKFARLTSEDQVNGGASVAGVYQPDQTTQIKAQAEYIHGHEDRGFGESAFVILDHPLSFDQVDAAVALNKRFDQYWASLGVSAVGLLFNNDTFQGVTLNQTYANLAIPTVTGRVGYVLAPLTSVFAEVSGNARDYQFQTLSSAGYRAVLGLLFEPGAGARIKGELLGGYIHQDYQGAGLQTVDTWTYGSALSFLITNNLTFTLEGRREAKESPLFNGSLLATQFAPTGGISLIETSIGGKFDCQIAPNVVVSAGATYLNDAFVGITEQDHYVSPFASISYTVTKNLRVGVDYHHLEFKPDVAGVLGFQKDVVLASLHVAF